LLEELDDLGCLFLLHVINFQKKLKQRIEVKMLKDLTAVFVNEV